MYWGKANSSTTTTNDDGLGGAGGGTSAGGGTGTSTGGTNTTTTPITTPLLAWEVIDQCMSLSNEPLSWVQAQDEYDILPIANYLNENRCSGEAKEFGLLAIEDMMLNKKVDLKESFASPFNIDLELVRPTVLNPEPEKVLFMCIYNKLIKTPQFKELFKNVFGDDERLHVKFEFATNLEPTKGATTASSYSYNPTTGDATVINQTIKLNKGWYGAKSDIKIAMSILHECVHAYLNVKQIECETNTTLNNLNAWELDDLINQIFASNNSCLFSDEPENQDDHHFMFNNLVPNISNTLSQLKDDLISEQHQLQAESNTFYNPVTNLSEDFEWNDFFKYLAMDGLNKTTTFKNEIENSELENTKYGFYSGNNAEGVTKNNCND